MKIVATGLALALAAAAYAAPPARPADDIVKDAMRKPADMVAFAKIAPGKTVADIIPGNGYFTRVFAAAVAPGGKVVAVIPPQAEQAYPDGAKAVRAMAADAGFGNITVVASPADPALAGTLDVAWTAQNYHDLHNGLPPEAVIGFNKVIFAALKPGGYYVIVDHSAVAGTGLAGTQTLHRIDPAVVKAEVVAAGFVFDGESAALANPADPRTAIVFDPSVRGKTDQFAYRFKKP